MIPNHIIEEIRQRVDVVEVISNYIPLKKRGNNYIACCPFHKEKTPSFTISQTKQMYHCFGCGATGDSLKFIMEHSGLDFVGAVEKLASICGVAIQYVKSGSYNESEASQKREIQVRKPGLHKIMSDIANMYRQNLKNNNIVQEYVSKRSISQSSIDLFEIGYASNIPLISAPALASQHISSEDLIALGMVVVDADHNRTYNRFNDRLIFPIKNVKGEIIAFGGRTFSPNVEPKYLNSAHTVLFDKSKEIYGLYQSLKTIKQENSIIVVEGYMDVVMMHQHGFSNAVASMGTSITEQQIKNLFRYSDSIYFMFDGDNAGKKAGWRALELSLPILQDHKQVYFVFLPDGEDPDSMLKQKGKDVLQQIIGKAICMSEFLIQYLVAQIPDLKKDSGKSRFLSLLRPYYNQLQSLAMKALMLQSVAEMIQLESYMIEQIIVNRQQSPRFSYGKYGKISKMSQQKTELTANKKNNIMLRRVLRSLLIDPQIARTLDVALYDYESLNTVQKTLINFVDYLVVDCDSFEDISFSKIEDIFMDVDFDIIELYKQAREELYLDSANNIKNTQLIKTVKSLPILDELKSLLGLSI